MVAILDIWPDPILQFWDLELDYAPCEIWEL